MYASLGDNDRLDRILLPNWNDSLGSGGDLGLDSDRSLLDRSRRRGRDSDSLSKLKLFERSPGLKHRKRLRRGLLDK